MRFLIDAQLPRALAIWLQQQGHDTVHTLDLPNGNRTSDTEICAIADAEKRTVVSKDADFVFTFELKKTPASLVLISTRNLSNAELLTLWQNNIGKITNTLNSETFIELTSDSLIARG